MTSFPQDLRYGWRALRKRPGFTLAAVLALAVGIGADAALFSVVNGLLLRPPVADSPERIVNVHSESKDGTGFHAFSYLDVVDLSHDNDAALLAPWSLKIMSLATGSDQPQVAAGQIVGDDYFEVFGVSPDAGRFFNGSAEADNGTAVISHRLWRRLGGGEPDTGREANTSRESVVGSTIRINQRPLTVIGVAPRGFSGPFGAVATDIWVPMDLQPLVEPGAEMDRRGFVWLEVVARLRDGVSPKQAEAFLDARYRQIATDNPGSHSSETGIHFSSFGNVPGQVRGGLQVFMAVLMAAVTLLLLVTCFDVAGMLLSRAAERRREIAVRLALGAGRLRLARQMITETLLLFAFGGASGLLLAHWATRLFQSLRLPIPVDLAVDFGLDGTVVAYTLGITLLVGVLFGLTPVVYATRLELRAHLDNGAARGGSRLRGHTWLVAAQVAVAVVLLVGSGLLLRALAAATEFDPGFDAKNVRMAELDLSLHGYENDAGLDFYHRLGERVAAVPGVEGVGFLQMMHLGLGNMTTGFSIDGVEPPPDDDQFPADYNVVSGGYFDALRVPLLAGRAFQPADASGAEVVIINQTLAERFWPGENPVGRRLRLGGADAAEAEIVGVAAAAKYRSLGETPRFYLYVPLSRNYEPSMTVVVRHDPRMPGATVAAALRAEIRALDPDLPVAGELAASDFIAVSLLPQRVAAAVTAVTGLVGLLLVAIGIYGVTAFGVAQRTRELGVRRALGAHRGDVVRLILGEGLKLAAVGLGAGLALSAVLGQFLRGLLQGVSPLDPWIFGLVPLFLLLVVAAGCLAPAVRAARVDPLEALRYE